LVIRSRWIGWLAGLTFFVTAVALCADDAGPDENASNLKRVPFEQLSERTVSRVGEAALNLTTVKWEHSETDHFIFHTETGFSVAQLAGAAEWCYAGIKKDLGITEDSFERKCHVYVFLSEPVWRQFVSTGKMEPWTGGWCNGRELFFWSRANYRFQGRTLPHELTHLVLHRFVGGDIPLWLNEGLAEFEGIRLSRTYLKIRRETMANIPDRLNPDQYVPLKDLTSAVDYPSAREAVAPFYTESQRMVNFLYFQGGGTAPLLKFIHLQSQGARFESAWREVYGNRYSSLESFEQKFIAYLTKPGE
jgi:hypothetical protein